ncbi:BglG family transcription antiterminator [Bacillota bacterium Lsc_1132]
MEKKRLHELLAFLLEQHDYISAKDIASQFNISQRTIYNDINTNEFQQLLNGASIDKKPKVGIKLIADEHQRKNIYNILNQSNFHSFKGNVLYDDVTNILLILFNSSHSGATFDFISKQLYMSKTTLEITLKNTEKWLSLYEISIERRKNYGLSLIGKETQIRKSFKDLCFNLQTLEANNDCNSPSRINSRLKINLDKIFTADVVNKTAQIVNTAEVNLNEAFTDYDYSSLITKLCILVLRNRIGKTVKSDHHFTNDIREQLVAQLIKIQLETAFHLNLTDDELNEITYYILTTRRQNNSQLFSYNSTSRMLIDQFTESLSNSLNIDLTKDEELKINLLNHLNPAIRRIRYGIKIENPLLTQIKYEYTSVYIATMTSIEEIEKNEKIVFDENELGYICLHIVAAINRSTKKRYISACLICDGGLTISTFLKSKIEKQFNEILITKIIPLNQFTQDIIEQFDLVLNSTNIPLYLNKNVISISSLLVDNDQDTIRSWIIKKEYQKLVHKENQIRNKILFFKDDLQDKNQLIKKYCKLLSIDNYVSEGFLQSVLDREKKASTSLARGIAVPHGTGDLVKKSVILAVLLEKPIPWDEQIVDLVFLIAINFNESKDYRYFFEKLFYIVSDNELITKIKKASNAMEIEKLIFDSNHY